MRCFSKLFVLSLFAYSHAKNVPSSRLADTDSHPTIYAIGHNKPVYAEGFLHPAQPQPLGKQNHAGKKGSLLIGLHRSFILMLSLA
jgi:hypothetical protein